MVVGPALKPLTLRAVVEVASRAAARCRIVACGGIRTAGDAVEAMLAGASAVQVGTATLVDPAAPVDHRQRHRRRATAPSLGSPAELRGAVEIGVPAPDPRGATRMIPRPENPDRARARRLRPRRAPSGSPAICAGEVGMLKVGLELFWAHGPEAVRRIATHGPVFVDCKLHDIPNTVERASANIARLGVAMLNVHALGGDAMMRAAVDGAQRGADEAGVAPPLVIAVTVLSSIGGDGLATPASLAWEAKEAGLDGVVVSGEDVRDVRDGCGEAFCLVVPGVRPAARTDTIRCACSRRARRSSKGADYLVVGRAITGAPDPGRARRGRSSRDRCA